MHINLTPQGLTNGVPERGDHAWPATARLLLPAGRSAVARMHGVTRLGMDTNRHILAPQGLAKAVTERYGCELATMHDIMCIKNAGNTSPASDILFSIFTVFGKGECHLTLAIALSLLLLCRLLLHHLHKFVRVY